MINLRSNIKSAMEKMAAFNKDAGQGFDDNDEEDEGAANDAYAGVRCHQ